MVVPEQTERSVGSKGGRRELVTLRLVDPVERRRRYHEVERARLDRRVFEALHEDPGSPVVEVAGEAASEALARLECRDTEAALHERTGQLSRSGTDLEDIAAGRNSGNLEERIDRGGGVRGPEAVVER